MRRPLLAVVAVAALVAAVAFTTPSSASTESNGDRFVKRIGNTLTLAGRPFRIAGSNNYYLPYKSQAMVDDVFARAAAAKFNVLRTWGWIDIGNQDGSNSVANKPDGVYFQYWDGTKPAYNDGADGLAHLDYVVWKAKQSGIRLVIPFTNNWSDFGGIDQYVRWKGGAYHDDFYTDATIKGWYKGWIEHLLNHVNPLTGLAYKADPTIMTWELGNEPRCKGSGVYPQSANCTTQTLVAWADEMTRYIKSVDRNHLTSVGDEGFFCDDASNADWTVNCGEGVDTIAFAKLRSVDVMSFHLYPNSWGKTPADQWGTDWIKRHFAEARKINKPAMLGEFGVLDKSVRNVVYRHWTDAVISSGGTGFLYWILSGSQDDTSLYPDYDGFTVYCPSPVCQTLTNAGLMLGGARAKFPPVADNDTAVTEFDTPVTLTPAANDIAYASTINAATIDLDPATAGQQASMTVSGGVFARNADNTVTFTPNAGFTGKVTASYTVLDARKRVSNAANLTVTVKPNPAAALTLFSFEEGTEGWGPASWQTDAGTVEQSTDFATAGTHSLKLNVTGSGGWFGLTFTTALDISTHGTLAFDLKTGPEAGTSRSLAIQTGSAWTWCQSPFIWQPQDTTAHVEVNLITDLADCSTGLNDIKAMYIFFNPSTDYLDNVVAN